MNFRPFRIASSISARRAFSMVQAFVRTSRALTVSFWLVLGELTASHNISSVHFKRAHFRKRALMLSRIMSMKACVISDFSLSNRALASDHMPIAVSSEASLAARVNALFNSLWRSINPYLSNSSECPARKGFTSSVYRSKIKAR